MIKSRTSRGMRLNQLFMRNEYPACGQWGIPLVKKQDINISDISLISYASTKRNESIENKRRGVHFFVDDYRFEGIYRNPTRSLDKLSQYAFLLTPDFSTYRRMQPWRQLESIAHSRWCGAYWQSKGLQVVPTITWSTPSSFRYCFDGVEKGSIVAVGMIGCRNDKRNFLLGYNMMLEKIEPSVIICVGKPFKEMDGNILEIEYRPFQKGAD
jgi:hypothetical protein